MRWGDNRTQMNLLWSKQSLVFTYFSFVLLKSERNTKWNCSWSCWLSWDPVKVSQVHLRLQFWEHKQLRRVRRFGTNETWIVLWFDLQLNAIFEPHHRDLHHNITPQTHTREEKLLIYKHKVAILQYLCTLVLASHCVLLSVKLAHESKFSPPPSPACWKIDW